MLSALAVAFAGTGPAERDYRLSLHAVPKTSIALRARMPEGWIAAFCTPLVCAPGHVVVRVPRSGQSVVALHIYRVRDTGRRTSDVVVSDDRGNSTVVHVSF